MKDAFEFLKELYGDLIKLPKKVLAMIILFGPIALYLVYMGYKFQHNRNTNSISVIQKVDSVKTMVTAIMERQDIQDKKIDELRLFIDLRIKEGDASVILYTANQMKYMLKWNKENSQMLFESIDMWSNSYQNSQILETDTTLNRTYKISVKKK